VQAVKTRPPRPPLASRGLAIERPWWRRATRQERSRSRWRGRQEDQRLVRVGRGVPRLAGQWCVLRARRSQGGLRWTHRPCRPLPCSPGGVPPGPRHTTMPERQADHLDRARLPAPVGRRRDAHRQRSGRRWARRRRGLSGPFAPEIVEVVLRVDPGQRAGRPIELYGVVQRTSGDTWRSW